MTTTLTLDEIRNTQPPADAIVGSIVAGFSIEGLKDAEAFTQLHAFAKEHGLSLFFGGGDAENADDDHLVSLYPWLLGIEMIRVEGGHEQIPGFEYKPGGRLDTLRTELAAKESAIHSLCTKLGASASAVRTFLVARGGLALALLLKGEWLEAPEETEDDPEELDSWLAEHSEPIATISSGAVGFRNGTRGSSQSPFPGVVHGICIAGADATTEQIVFDAAKDAELDAKLKQAGIAKPRYFLITRYD